MKSQFQFKIVILEDSDFYNKILTRQLQHYTNEIALDKGYNFDIQSYTSVNDCLRNLRADTDIAIVDFYLGESKNALDILKVIKQTCSDCKVIIISRAQSIEAYYQTLNEGAYHFIYKDGNALTKSCFIVEDIIMDRIRTQLT